MAREFIGTARDVKELRALLDTIKDEAPIRIIRQDHAWCPDFYLTTDAFGQPYLIVEP